MASASPSFAGDRREVPGHRAHPRVGGDVGRGSGEVGDDELVHRRRRRAPDGHRPGEQPPGEQRPDEPGPAGDNDPHTHDKRRNP